MLQLKLSEIIIPRPGQIKAERRAIIKALKQGSAETYFIIKACGRVERYFGTTQTKQGWTKITYDQSCNRKRQGIPQWSLVPEGLPKHYRENEQSYGDIA